MSKIKSPSAKIDVLAGVGYAAGGVRASSRLPATVQLQAFGPALGKPQMSFRREIIIILRRACERSRGESALFVIWRCEGRWSLVRGDPSRPLSLRIT